MSNFITIPATVIPQSSKTSEEGIVWAKELIDIFQESQDSNTYATAIYTNLKTNESGQILSTKYGKLVRDVFSLDEIPRVFINTVITESTIGSHIPSLKMMDGLTSTEINELINSSKQSILDNLKLSDKDIEEIADKLANGTLGYDIKADVVALLDSNIDNEEIRDTVIAFKKANLPISITDIITEVQKQVTQDVISSLDIQQAQTDVVSGAVAFLTGSDKLEDIINSAYIGTFRTVIGNLAGKNAELAKMFEEDGRMNIVYSNK